MRPYRTVLIVILIFAMTTLAAAQRPESGTRDAASKTEQRTLSVFDLGAATDSCYSAADVPLADKQALIDGQILSYETVTNLFTIASEDPDLSACFDGIPPVDTTGYRTGWYKFEAPTTGRLHVEAAPNFSYQDNYDTIIAVYQATSCTGLGVPLLSGCNDDANGLLSKVEMQVVQGQTYYVEIADVSQAVNGLAKLSIQMWIEEDEAQSETDVAWVSELSNRSRHMTAAIGENIYVIGGQTFVDDVAPLRTSSVGRFNTRTKTWTEMAPMPAGCAFDNAGYSNMDAAVIGNEIFVPTGYVGDSVEYADNHCIYNTRTDSWRVGVSPEWIADPAIYAAVVSDTRPGVNRYYVIGGLNGPYDGRIGTSSAQSVVYTYDAIENGGDWASSIQFSPNAIPAMPGDIYAHTGAMIADRYLCVVGGLRPTDANTTLLASVLCLDLSDDPVESGQWFELTNKPITTRFMADSVVGADGRWYVFGGYTSSTISPSLVPSIEVFNFDEESGIKEGNWERLNSLYNIDGPQRSWARGEVVGHELYVIGGETLSGDDIRVANVVEKIDLTTPVLANQVYLPIMAYNNQAGNIPSSAPTVAINSTVTGDFNTPGDTIDLYRIEVPRTMALEITLSGMPSNENGSENYDLYVYDGRKQRIANSRQFGTVDETLTLAVNAGTYYVAAVIEGPNSILVQGTYSLEIKEE